MPDRVSSTLEIVASAKELLAAHAALILRVRSAQQIHRLELQELDSPPTELLKLPLIPTSPATPSPEEELESPPPSPQHQNAIRQDLAPAKRARATRYVNYVPEEETIRNDYSQRYVDSGEWPQNWVLGAEPEHRFEEYPKQKRLLDLKKSTVNRCALPPTYLPYSDLTSLQPCKFDVILLDPPFNSTFTWHHLEELPIPSLASDPSFVFLWVGSGAGEGLERGREVLAKWGYRRCEDVVWVRTNKTTNQGPGTDPPTTSVFTRTKQHCLMGIRGTVRRSTDSWFVHCNVDTDVIFWEGDPTDPTRKPPEMYTLIENFCLGTRRLEVFGKRSSLRRGWVSVFAPGQEESLGYMSDGSGKIPVETEGEDGIPTPMVATRWMQDSWEEGIKGLSGSGKLVVPMTPEIDALRPKSPIRGGQAGSTGGGQGPPGPIAVGSGGAVPGVSMPMNMGNLGPGTARYPPGNNRMGNAGNNQVMPAQNPMIIQPMMGMNVGPLGMGMDEMLGSWNPMMGTMGVGGMNLGLGGGVGLGSGGMQSGTMGAMGANRGMPNTGMGMTVGLGGQGVPMQMMNQMGQMGMGGINSFQGLQAGGGFMGGIGGPVFNNEMNTNWNEQGQFGGMDGGWDEGQAMGGMNVVGSMNAAMNMGNMGLGMGQNWGNSGTF